MDYKILKFSANWCAPCKALASQLVNYNKHEIVSYDMDQNPEEFTKHYVRNLPTVIFINNSGKEISRRIGSLTLSEFENWVKEAIEDNEKLDS